MNLGTGLSMAMGMSCTECGQLIGCDPEDCPTSETQMNLSAFKSQPGLNPDDFTDYSCPKCGQRVVREKEKR